VLYWFRTPPGVKVGRAALDEEAIRLIEQLNPGIEFDWTRILKGQGAPPTESRPPADVRRQRPDNRRPQPSPPSVPSRSAQPAASREPGGIRTAERASVAADPQPALPRAGGASGEEFFEAVPPTDTPTPAHAKLGAEGVERLRARYAEILARISERAADPLRREELKLQADRLNPDAWVTAEEVVQGLEQYESVFASLREVVGQTRRRRRRGNRPRQGEPGGATGDASSNAANESGAGSDGEPSNSPEGNPDDEGSPDDGDSAPGES
jgi:hypothetical protein